MIFIDRILDQGPGRGRRWIFLALFCLSLVVVKTASGDDGLASPLELRVGAYENPPKVYTDTDNRVVGLFPDILNHIAQKEGWRISYVHGTWSQCLERLETQDIDLMIDVAYSEKRAAIYDFSHETVLVNWAVVYTGTTVPVESLIDLRGKRVAVMKGSIHTEGAEGIKHLAARFDIPCRFLEVDNYEAVFQRVSTGDADAGVVNRLFGALHEEDYTFRKTSILFNPRHLRFALPKGSALSAPLTQKLDAHLHEMKRNPKSISHKAIAVYLSGLPRELIFSESGTGSPEASSLLTMSEKEWISDHPVIRLGIDPEFAPFEYLTPDNRYDGIASDYIRLLNERLGLHMQVMPGLTWKEAVHQVRTGGIDVLPCVGITRERTRFLNFTKPYINFYRVIITRTDRPFLTGLDDVRDMRVAVQANSSHEGYLKDNTPIQPVRYDTLESALLAVSYGRTDAFIGNLTSSTYWIRKLNLTNLKVAAPVSQDTHTLHFAVRKDWPELIKILNKGLATISREETNQIHRRWVNIEYKPGISRRMFWKYTLQAVCVMALILSVILFWNYRLKREIRKRIEIEDQLFAANKNLRTLDRLKSMFIASMSHELRTPLNSIIGFTGVILQGMTGPLNDKQTDHLSRVYHSAKHLLALITDVIDISKIEAGRIEVFPQDIRLADLVEEALVNVQPQLREKSLGLEKDVPEDLEMHTDRKRLLQCIINYLSNAVKYTETGTIRILARQQGDQVEILVSDTGIGIPEAAQGKLFEAFERIDSHLRVKAGGTGLGLYLTRKLVSDILGGRVSVQSRPGTGSTFGLKIPTRIARPDTPEQNTGDITP